MAKLRKVKRQKKYRYNVNRKRLRNKVEQKGKIGWYVYRCTQHC